MGRQFLGRTFTLGGQPWYLERGRAGTCDACAGRITTDQPAFRRTFGFLFNKRHRLVHEECMTEWALQMEATMAWARQMRQR